MVAECSQGTSFLLEGPSARSATNHSSPETSGKTASGPAPSTSGEISQTLRSSPTRSLPLAQVKARARERSNRDIEHRTRLKKKKREKKKKDETRSPALTRAAHIQSTFFSFLFHHHPGHFPWGLALASRTGLKAPASLPSGVNRIPRKNGCLPFG